MSVQQTDLMIQIGAIPLAFLQIAPIGSRVILDAYKTVWLSRYITAQGKLYQIVEIKMDKEKPGKIMARLEER